ncbi:MAG: hypothetical protein Q8R60_02375 [Mycobacteriales bacterium]|nr:hypothetical protein [Mycobacteriales bacterium]
MDLDPRMRAALASLAVGAGVVHVAVAPEHADHHWTMGLAMALTAWAQLGWAAAVVIRPSRLLLLVGAAASGVLVLAYAAVSVVGWPLGPSAGEPEAQTAAGLLASGLELLVVLAVPLALGAWRVPRLLLPAAGVLVVGSTTSLLVLGGGGHAVDAGRDAGHEGRAHLAAAPAGTQPQGAQPQGTHGHPADTTPPTAEQQVAAERLRAATVAGLVRYADVAAAEAAGYRVVHDADGKLLHYAHPGYQADGRLLDPQKVESLLYVVLPDGRRMLVGGMYITPKGQTPPQPGGSLTSWHAHDDLCLDATRGIAITQLPGGGCPAGSAVGTTGEMLHVWSIPYATGPFAELDAATLRAGVVSALSAA